MDTLQQCLITQALWYYLVYKGGGNAPDQYIENWSIQAQGVPSAILTFTVLRYTTTEVKKYWTYIALVPVLLAFVLSLYTAVKSFSAPTPLVYVFDRNSGSIDEGTTALLGTANVSCLIADIAIAIIGFYQLFSRRSRTMGNTKGVVNTLIRYTLTTGLLSRSGISQVRPLRLYDERSPSIITLLCLILYVANSGVTYGSLLAAFFVHAKIYVNCMLAALNNRGQLRARIGGTVNIVSPSDFE
ncbi:hypothetical protein GLOTRDRAFT_131674 [Gloeophyllum trabeum ATCC 11539]|uniref:DUF6534 domain-containing protein n=1 Tax=Gloeophyllum trabeum (strain ATCC 11539 / FP-39264 / Madison 617) TaxID=670483 RepID=S7PXU3_GLOTA|nr:uncharacterized protein GLOTRDRAFT_131674 [Gloeophyllum trabeum ATCC 11539]EPQ52431.1 hypothetical protein GLOTRDRAFT_131674 [Gloeophyllum trabeum ATCC 11539]